MAQIVTITNPLTGQPVQVDQLEHTAQQIDDAIDRAKAGGEIDTLLSNKAPTGYGLGTSAVPIDDYNNAVNNGWYRGGANYPSKISYAQYGMVRVDSIGQVKFQTFYAGDTGNAMISPFMAIRKSGDYGATWSEWEYVNPPMLLGVEYRTTERYQGKPVYVKAIDLGTLPNATSKTVEWGSNNVQPIRYSGRTETVGRFAFPYASYIQCAVSGNSIVVYTTANYSAYTASLVVYYTKTTD